MAPNENPSTKGIAMSKTKKQYKLRNFLFDVLMTFFTGGFWLIWIFVREMRS